jgi:glycosyltransferase involved in cell wall biosynthesis/nucleoside-diphosphate-sugar epimerase
MTDSSVGQTVPATLSTPEGGTWVIIGTGFIGSALAKALQSRSVSLRVVHAPRVAFGPESTVDDIVHATVDRSFEKEISDLTAKIGDASVVVNAAGVATPDAPASAMMTGANGLLPSLIFAAASQRGVHRVIHLSSAAVQGRARVLTESKRKTPDSAYGRSKALGEDAVLRLASALHAGGTQVRTQLRILRATSVQGPLRQTSTSLARIARSSLATVAGDRPRPSPVSSLAGLTDAIISLANSDDAPPVVLQPWEGLTARTVLERFGGKTPQTLPPLVCRVGIALGYAFARLLGGRFRAHIRRLDVMWFGQRQVPGWLVTSGLICLPHADQPREPTVLFGATAALTARVFMLEQCRYLAQRGWEVHLATSDGTERTPVPEFTWHTLTMQRTISPRADLRSAIEWIRLIRRVRPDVVMVGTPKAGLLGIVGSYFCRIPVRVYLVRGLRAEGLTGRTRTVSLLAERLSTRLATHIVSVGEDLKSRLAQHRIAPRDRIDVIGHGGSNGVDTARFRPSTEEERRAIRRQLGVDGKIVVGFVGRVTLGKGLADALSTVRALNADGDRARLLVVGDFEAENPVPEQMMAELDAPYVVRTGRVLDTAPYYRAMDIYLHLSRYEGLPNAILEAGASGLPVVTTDATGCGDALINGQSGYVVPLGDIDEVKRRTEFLCQHPGARRDMGEAGRRFVSSYFTNEVVWRNLLCYLNSIVVLEG